MTHISAQTASGKRLLLNFRKFSGKIQVFWDVMMVRCVKVVPMFRGTVAHYNQGLRYCDAQKRLELPTQSHGTKPLWKLPYAKQNATFTDTYVNALVCKLTEFFAIYILFWELVHLTSKKTSVTLPVCSEDGLSKKGHTLRVTSTSNRHIPNTQIISHSFIHSFIH
jgi:hypothetical protein